MTDERTRRFEQDLDVVLRQLAGEAAPASLRYRLADVVATEPLERRSWFSPPLRWAVAVVAVVAVAVAAMLMVPRENVGPVPTSSAHPTATGATQSGTAAPTGGASPTASPPVSPSPSPTPMAWKSLTWSAGVPLGNGQLVQDLTMWGDGFVAVGGVDDGSGFDPAFFTSTDGARWTLVSRVPTSKTGEVAGLLAVQVVALDDRLLAVGEAVMNTPGVQPDTPAPLWVSRDGTTWTRIHSVVWDAVSPWPGRLLAGAGGVVAVGGGVDPAILFSVDGSAWTRVTLPAAEHAIVRDATVFPGGFAIVGRDGQPDQVSEAVVESPAPPGVGRPGAWISADGVHWSEATVEGNNVAGAGLGAVVPMGDGLLAVGINGTADFYEGTATSWTSTDGGTWAIATAAQWPMGPYTASFASDGEHALVLGAAPGGSSLGIWVTNDGIGWTRLAFASADNAPQTDCETHADCVRAGPARLTGGRLIVVGTPAFSMGEGAQRVWVAVPGP